MSRLLAACLVALSLCAAPEKTLAGATSGYPDRPAGLEKLAQDILKAQTRGTPEQSEALIQGVLLPDPLGWYSAIFDEATAKSLAKNYGEKRAEYAKLLGEFFSSAGREGFTEPVAKRFESSCDDNAGEEVFGVLFARDVPVPLYDLRLYKGRVLRRLWAWAYVDGAFRFVSTLRPPQRVMRLAGGMPGREPGENEEVRRVRVSAALQEAQLIHRVTPSYPGVAMSEHLEGTVRIHAIIGTDGTLRAMQVVSGYCSLAESAVDAVRRWRYKPTEIAGKPVEVDTIIDVSFRLSR